MGIKQEMPVHLVLYADGTEEEARGYIWKVGKDYYFDKFAKGSRQLWVDRFNSMYGQKLESRRQIFELIGQENFSDFKRQWAAANLQRVLGYKITQNDDPYTWDNLLKIMGNQLGAEERQMLELWIKSKNNEK